MEFLNFDSILNLLAAFGCGCLGIMLLGRQSLFGMFMLLVSFGFIGLSKQTVDIDFAIAASVINPNLLESSNALSFALIIFTFMAANSLRIGSSIVMILVVFGFGLISAQVLQKSGLVIGPYIMMSGLIFATALTFMSLHLMTQRQHRVGSHL